MPRRGGTVPGRLESQTPNQLCPHCALCRGANMSLSSAGAGCFSEADVMCLCLHREYFCFKTRVIFTLQKRAWIDIFTM